jgi:hypothetical protein
MLMKTGLLENLMTAEAVLSALREQFAEPEDAAWCFDAEKVTTLVRGLDLMTLLISDAGRRLQGCPPASLDGAVQTFLEQVDRIASEPRYALLATPSPRTH